MDGDLKNELIDLKFDYAHFKGEPIFAAAQITINRGERVNLVAPIGAGKTTLLEILCGLRKDFCGFVFGEINREVVRGFSVSFIPSAPVLFENKSVKNNLLYAAKVCGASLTDADFDNLLKTLDCDFDQNIKVKKLNNTNKQKVAFLRALIKKPDLILIDDLFLNAPTKVSQDKILNLLDSVCLNLNESAVVIASTSALNLKTKFDKVLTIKNRKIVEMNKK